MKELLIRADDYISRPLWNSDEQELVDFIQELSDALKKREWQDIDSCPLNQDVIFKTETTTPKGKRYKVHHGYRNDDHFLKYIEPEFLGEKAGKALYPVVWLPLPKEDTT